MASTPWRSGATIGRERSSHPSPVRWLTLLALILTLFPVIAPASPVHARTVADAPRTAIYFNPLSIQIPSGGQVTDCPDPSIIHGHQAGDTAWYLYCTTDPLNNADHDPTPAPDGSFTYHFHLITMHRSYDLVHWTYLGDAFTARPSWVKSDAGLWAPDIHFFNGQYYLYYTASDTVAGGSAIGVATSSSPTGPWVDHGSPVVEPHAAPCCPGSQRWVYDPSVIQDDNGQKYIFYGSYFGGISARTLSADGFSTDPASETQITIANRYEGSYIVKHDGYYYFFGSATNCCNGPLTGYSVFAGRSRNVLGPYVDREGVSLLTGRVGGTPVISMNGNRWVGPGHNAVFTDFAGHDWFLYHAVDRNDPYFAGNVGFTRRPALMDRLDWIDGWPTVRGGLWASDTPQRAPRAQPGGGREDSTTEIKTVQPDLPGKQIAALSDEFNSLTLGSQWTWIRQPDAGTYGLDSGTFRFDVQPGKDLNYSVADKASVLTEPVPNGDYLIETRLQLSVPPEGCCQNYTQAGLVIYGDDNNFIKLAHVSIFETRQTEFAKQIYPVPAGYPRYGNTVVGPPGDWTYLRIVRTAQGNQELYRAYTSQDGVNWVRGGVWTHHLGTGARIGLVSMAAPTDGPGFTAHFDYLRVYRLRHGGDDGRSDDVQQ